MGSETITLPYGENTLSLDIDPAVLVGEYRIADIPPVPDLGVAIRAALAAPIGTERLSRLVRGAGKVVIVSDDATRMTPVREILPYVMEELEAAGLSDEQIVVVMANGTHRPMACDEIEAKIGRENARRLRVENHDYKATDLVDLGSTASGVPIMVNRTVAEADFVIGIGSIIPHRYCGWSGGAKIIQPGVCGEETTVATHLMITRDPGVRLGNVENVVRHEMEAVAERAGLRFIVNVVLNSVGEVAHIVAGHPVAAHREGVKRAVEVASARIPALANVVIAGSHPADLNFWQAGKSLYTADLVVSDGGTVILVTPAYEGMGEHPEFGALIALDYEKILELLNRGFVGDRLGAAGALAVRLVARRANIVVVTDGLSREEVEAMGFAHYPISELQRAVDETIAKYSAPKVTVFPEAPDVLPVVSSDAVARNEV